MMTGDHNNTGEGMGLSGIHPIVPTPFDESGRVDVDSIKRLVEFMVGLDVQGVAILGVMGEGQKLSDAEQRQVTEAFRSVLPDTLDLVVGVRAAGTDPAVAAAGDAAGRGATALLVGPPPVQSDDAIFTYYQRIGEATDLPIVVHDYPASTGILMSAPLLARLYREIDTVQYIKLEDPPTGPKISRVLDLAGEGLGIFGALGGMYMLEELERGAVGIMTGFAYPELLLAIYRSYKDGDIDTAARIFYDILPLIRFEFQPGLGVSLRKNILVQRGVFRTAKVRHPGADADARTLKDLARILEHLRQRGYDV
jgi:4-hydroxy-tetrahydrodipicolinate synthase